MAVGAVAEPDRSAARYEALIRISNSIRARKEPQELFQLLVDELKLVIPFDAIAQFDESSNKIHWHLGPGCQKNKDCRSEVEDARGDNLPQFVFRTQETVVLGSMGGDMLFPNFA